MVTLFSPYLFYPSPKGILLLPRLGSDIPRQAVPLGGSPLTWPVSDSPCLLVQHFLNFSEHKNFEDLIKNADCQVPHPEILIQSVEMRC